jgi:hypothetical protein
MYKNQVDTMLAELRLSKSQALLQGVRRWKPALLSLTLNTHHPLNCLPLAHLVAHVCVCLSVG